MKSGGYREQLSLYSHLVHHQMHDHSLRTYYVRAEVVADLIQDEVDVVLPRDWVCRHVSGRVGRPGDGHLLPGQEEDDTTVACRRIEQTHVVRTEIHK